jgi:hypothetical protein
VPVTLFGGRRPMGNLNRRSVLRRAGFALLGTGAASRLEPQAVAQHAGSKPPVQLSSKAEDCNCSFAAPREAPAEDWLDGLLI